MEYKRGKPKPDDRDALQLCAQAMCLEEMMNVAILEGDLFYHEIRKREQVVFSEKLRARVADLVAEMKQMYAEARTPEANYKSHCRQCSLVTLCKPKWSGKKAKSAAAYVQGWIGAEEL
ncbi:CRISPR-associated protein Cas4 [Paenibacillus sp. 598K]|uniref:CRISPR-associated protein Cas4 n=1 Tax=Paenibacillus sp. 598K TaxID=1117987 RepID=UPI0035E3E261